MLTGKTFYVTGATGRLGCTAVERLEEMNAEVIPVVFGHYPDKPKRILWKAATEPVRIKDTQALNGLKEPHYVIHFHWAVNRSLSYLEQLDYELKQNIFDLKFFWDWLLDKKLDRFVNISTIKVFSHLNEDPVCNETEPRPNTPYGVAKLAGEKLFDSYYHDSAFAVVHLRLSSVASFGEHPTHLLSRLYKSAFENERIIINNDHLVYLFYIDEIVDLIINAAVNAKANKYLMVKEGRPVEEIARKFEGIAGRKINGDYRELASGHNEPEFISNHRELEADWVRSVDLDTAISNIIKLNIGKIS